MTAMQKLIGTTALLAMGALIGCSQAETVTKKVTATTTEKVMASVETAKDGAEKMAKEMKGADLSALPSGTYKSEQGHAYVAFSYSHQGYANPILRWGETNATVVFDNENPENSTLEVMIPVASVDSGVAKFDDHLVSADFFDAENHPTIIFKSTDIDEAFMGGGSVTGDLTIKGITKPVTFKGQVNKVGKNFRSGVDMFGVSAKGYVKRSDFGVDKYAPNVGDDVKIVIEVEFQKEG